MVVFKDISCDYAFLSRSTVETKETIQWEDGKEYPLIKLEISHMSHPFYTGKMKLVDTAGRVDKFRNRYKKHTEKIREISDSANEWKSPCRDFFFSHLFENFAN